MSNSSGQATVLIVDDEPLTCKLLARVISRAKFDVVGIVHEGNDALELVEALEPNIVLLDLTLPGGRDGMSTLRLLQETSPKVRILVLTGHKDPSLVREALSLGASGYINKSESFLNIPQIMENLLEGDIAIVEPDLMKEVVRANITHLGRLAEKENLVSRLTAREVTVLDLIAQGYANRKIAEELFISPNTVKAHTRRIFDKLRVSDRTQAALVALEAGLGR